jgi:hypothetical protein
MRKFDEYERAERLLDEVARIVVEKNDINGKIHTNSRQTKDY